MKKVEDYLEQLGLSPIEAKLYYGLLKMGSSTIKELAETVGLNRVTTHFQINGLIKKGLVVQIKKGLRRQITAEPPIRLGYLVEQKEKEIKILRENLPSIIHHMSSGFLHSNSGEDVKVKYYQGTKAIQMIYKEILTAKKIYSFVNVNKITKVFPENPNLFRQALEDDTTKEMWEIIEDSRESREHINNINIRYHYVFVPLNISLYSSDFVVYDENFAMIYIEPNNPYAIVTNSPGMTAGIKGIHRIVWNILSGKDY